MSTGLVTFNGMNLPAELSQQMLAMNAAANGGFGGGLVNRISLKGSRFKLVTDGVESAPSIAPMHVVVVGAKPNISRIYYSAAYDPDNSKVKPTCWSDNGIKPSTKVLPENKQNNSCEGCPQNEVGSKMGVGNKPSRACAYKKRMVVVAPDALLDNPVPYQLDIAAMSLFGDGVPAKGQHSWGGYMKMLTAHQAPVMALVTKVEFDLEASVPKLYFSVASDVNNNAMVLTTEQCEAAIAVSKSKTVLDMLEDIGAVEEFEQLAAPAPAAVAKPAPVAVAKPAPVAVAKPAPVAVAKPAPVAVAKPAPAPAPAAVAKPEWVTIATEAGIEGDDIDVLDGLGGPATDKGFKYWTRLMGSTPWQQEAPAVSPAAPPASAQSSLGDELAKTLAAFDDE